MVARTVEVSQVVSAVETPEKARVCLRRLRPRASCCGRPPDLKRWGSRRRPCPAASAKRYGVRRTNTTGSSKHGVVGGTRTAPAGGRLTRCGNALAAPPMPPVRAAEPRTHMLPARATRSASRCVCHPRSVAPAATRCACRRACCPRPSVPVPVNVPVPVPAAGVGWHGGGCGRQPPAFR